MKKEKIYLSGPMRGIEDFNFPAFHEATAKLRGLGLEVFSAAEYEEKLFGVGFNKSKHGDLKDIQMPDWDFRDAFAKDCDYICNEADAIVCLPGWEKSKGALAEVAIARALGILVVSYPTLNTIHPEPTDEEPRKQYPLATGCIDYFPDALREVARCSQVGNEQHNPGTPMHWDRSKSGDEADALMRHFVERGMPDADGVRHSAKVAWRALALLQKEIEKEAK